MKKKLKGVPIVGLIVAGIIAAAVGLLMILRPITYFSSGGIGHMARTPTLSVFSGRDTVFIGWMILFMAGFILWFAYRVKKG